MDIKSFAEILKNATSQVFSTMLGTDVQSLEPYEDLNPFTQSEVTAFIGLAGDFQGYLSLHVSRAQAADFTARLVGVEVSEVTVEAELLDGVGEITNMIAGSMKAALSSKGLIEIALPTVSTTPKAELRVRGGQGLVVPFEDYTGVFYVELVLASGGPRARGGALS